MLNALHELTETIHTHSAVNNAFFKKWNSEALSIQKIGKFARNYREFTLNFPRVLAKLLSIIEDVPAQVEYAKILYSELGFGVTSKAHSLLFENFCGHLAERLENPGYLSPENLKTHFSLLSATQDLIIGEKKLYEDIHVGVGAQLALECQAYPMLSQLYEGSRNYSSLWPNTSSFHESCEFFYTHIGSTEKEHRLEALEVASRVIKNEEHFQKIEFGFKNHLDLIANFWSALANDIDNNN